MPFTPYHFGPHACVAISLYRYLDIRVFIGAIIDFEPLIVTTFNLDYPLHGYCHTLVIGSLLGLAWATAAYPLRHFIGKIMTSLRLPYAPTFAKMAISGVVGVWLHVLFDAPIYYDIQPFYPIKTNPIFGSLSLNAGYDISAACFVPALLMYVFYAFVRKGRGIGVRS
jgi:membrane-bound metal-dependent hydrolase YbcI (DUF457 family)